MNEIEKMYEKCNFEKSMGVGSPVVLHPFTAEKQLELIKICFDKYERLEKVRGLKERCIIYHHFESNDYTEFVNCETWEETIAGLINNLWQSLTEEEKQQVKGILE